MLSSLVRGMRLELTCRNRHYPLKVACLPISPPAPLSIYVLQLSSQLAFSDRARNRTRTCTSFEHSHLKRARLPIPPPGLTRLHCKGTTKIETTKYRPEIVRT